MATVPCIHHHQSGVQCIGLSPVPYEHYRLLLLHFCCAYQTILCRQHIVFTVCVLIKALILKCLVNVRTSFFKTSISVFWLSHKLVTIKNYIFDYLTLLFLFTNLFIPNVSAAIQLPSSVLLYI